LTVEFSALEGDFYTPGKTLTAKKIPQKLGGFVHVFSFGKAFFQVNF